MRGRTRQSVCTCAPAHAHNNARAPDARACWSVASVYILCVSDTVYILKQTQNIQDFLLHAFVFIEAAN